MGPMMRSAFLAGVFLGAGAPAPEPGVPGAAIESSLKRRTRKALHRNIREVRNLRAKIEAGEGVHDDFLPKEYEIFFMNAFDPNDEVAVREIVMVGRKRGQDYSQYLGGPRALTSDSDRIR